MGGVASRARRGFNSATTRRPWRHERSWLPVEGTVLQFGHDPEAVETHPVGFLTRRSGMLQFGHDPEAVETRCACSRSWTT